MQGPSWVGILRAIPAAQHEKLVLTTANGTEINLQGVLRIERDYLMIRGRIAASTESGRVFFLPYDQINYLGFREGMKEAEILAIFGDNAAPPPPAAPTPPPVPVEPAVSETITDPGTKTEAFPAAGVQPMATADAASGRLSQSAKAALLERLRKARSSHAAARSGS